MSLASVDTPKTGIPEKNVWKHPNFKEKEGHIPRYYAAAENEKGHAKTVGPFPDISEVERGIRESGLSQKVQGSFTIFRLDLPIK